MPKVNPIPNGFHTVTPYLVAKNCAKVLAFAKKAFGAKVVTKMEGPRGSVMHAEFTVGDSMVMLGECRKPMAPMPAMLCVYVPNVDAVYAKAVKAGGKSIQKPTDMFYGDRAGGVKDPCGNHWWIHTHIENLTDAEVRKRAAAMGK